MGLSQSREDELSDSESEATPARSEAESEDYQDANGQSSAERTPKTPSSVDEVEAKLRAPKLKYATPQTQNPHVKNPVKLYLHIGGHTSEKLTSYDFVKNWKWKGMKEGSYWTVMFTDSQR
ncbi:hypothetical protein CRG98_024930 [Punica granatum]|uniref:DUF7135 domain-containing protein n=1 Tax=Punica granatum TaxID=22663 RepID=A0A2I0JGA9_PUNGR|nr:hypothetical protein CRG98_024930 [Punica granatum]